MLIHVTRKIVSEMTYNELSGMLNPTIPYHTLSSVIDDLKHKVNKKYPKRHVLQS